ncbi:hypothetical protein B0T21DRAFT_390567 [Apiosordaria backusii]|uniref:Uncharacterized protein n=1 Tax=Apiosordaria backusii TaxID=314023 RepID=A0AA40K0P8_9PEZI|nr:hypothetical protein B0T21DRAFT_390567 [Apiosordaria backusii]
MTPTQPPAMVVVRASVLCEPEVAKGYQDKNCRCRNCRNISPAEKGFIPLFVACVSMSGPVDTHDVLEAKLKQTRDVPWHHLTIVRRRPAIEARNFNGHLDRYECRNGGVYSEVEFATKAMQRNDSSGPKAVLVINKHTAQKTPALTGQFVTSPKRDLTSGNEGKLRWPIACVDVSVSTGATGFVYTPLVISGDRYYLSSLPRGRPPNFSAGKTTRTASCEAGPCSKEKTRMSVNQEHQQPSPGKSRIQTKQRKKKPEARQARNFDSNSRWVPATDLPSPYLSFTQDSQSNLAVIDAAYVKIGNQNSQDPGYQRPKPNKLFPHVEQICRGVVLGVGLPLGGFVRMQRENEDRGYRERNSLAGMSSLGSPCVVQQPPLTLR